MMSEAYAQIATADISSGIFTETPPPVDGTLVVEFEEEWYNLLINVVMHCASGDMTLRGLAPDIRLLQALEGEVLPGGALDCAEKAKFGRLVGMCKASCNFKTCKSGTGKFRTAWPLLDAVLSVCHTLVSTDGIHVLMQRSGFKDTTRLRPHQHEAVVSALVVMLVQDVREPLYRQLLDHDMQQYRVLGGILASGTSDLCSWPQSASQVPNDPDAKTRRVSRDRWTGAGSNPSLPAPEWTAIIEAASASGASDSGAAREALTSQLLFMLRLLCLSQERRSGYALFDSMGLGKTLEMLAIALLRRRIAHSDESVAWGELIRRSTNVRVSRKAPILMVSQELSPFYQELKNHTTLSDNVDKFTSGNAAEMRKHLKTLRDSREARVTEVAKTFSGEWIATVRRAFAVFTDDPVIQALRNNQLSLSLIRRFVLHMKTVMQVRGRTNPWSVEFGKEPKWVLARDVEQLQCRFELAEPVAFASSLLLVTPSILRSKTETGPMLQSDLDSGLGLREGLSRHGLLFLEVAKPQEWEIQVTSLLHVMVRRFTPTPLAFGVVCLDEAHKYRTQDRSWFALAFAIQYYGPIVAATGTPLCNKRSDLANLLALLGHWWLASAFYTQAELDGPARRRLEVMRTTSMRARTDAILTDMPECYSRDEVVEMTLSELFVYLSVLRSLSRQRGASPFNGGSGSSATTTRKVDAEAVMARAMGRSKRSRPVDKAVDEEGGGGSDSSGEFSDDANPRNTKSSRTDTRRTAGSPSQRGLSRGHQGRKRALTYVLRLRQMLLHPILAVNIGAARADFVVLKRASETPAVVNVIRSSLGPKAVFLLCMCVEELSRGVSASDAAAVASEFLTPGVGAGAGAGAGASAVDTDAVVQYLRSILFRARTSMGKVGKVEIAATDGGLEAPTASAVRSGFIGHAKPLVVVNNNNKEGKKKKKKKRTLPLWMAGVATESVDRLAPSASSMVVIDDDGDGDGDAMETTVAISADPTDKQSKYCQRVTSMLTGIRKSGVSSATWPVAPVPVSTDREEAFRLAMERPTPGAGVGAPTRFEKALLEMASSLSPRSVSSKEARILRLLMEVHPAEKMVVFTSFAVEAEHLMLVLQTFGIGAVKLAGGMNPTDKRDAEQKLQTDSRIRVAVCTLATAAHCYTFTAARVLVMMDPWWAKYMDKQARKRIHRMGQTKTTVVYAFRARVPAHVIEALGRAAGDTNVSPLTMDDSVYTIQHDKESEARRMLGHDLSKLDVQAYSGGIQHKQAIELVDRTIENTRALCTDRCVGVLHALGMNPITAAVLTAARRGVR